MIQSKQKVKNLCDKLIFVNPAQIVIDLVQDEIEDRLYSEDVTPDEIGALVYECAILFEAYNPSLLSDHSYLSDMITALREWEADAGFANKSLGLDPNK